MDGFSEHGCGCPPGGKETVHDVTGSVSELIRLISALNAFLELYGHGKVLLLVDMVLRALCNRGDGVSGG